MYCYQCGTELSGQARFCSGCGRSLDAIEPPAKASQRNMSTHVNILGWLFVGSSVLSAMLGFTLLVARRILPSLPIPIPPDVPFDVIQFVTGIAGILGIAILIVAAATAAAGIGILQYKSWGRGFALVMATVMMLKVPFGTFIGIYAFWVLLSQRGKEHFERESAVAEGRA